MYGKIFEFMYEGSLYGQWEAIVTFQQMIVIADDERFVDITPPALAAKTSIPLGVIEKGIEVLESDDPYSRTPGEDGKRIVRISDKRPWGWQIVNYQKYRNMASNEDRKRYMREYMQKRRKQEKLTSKQTVNSGKQPLADVTHTDTYTDTNTKKKYIKKKFTPPTKEEVIKYFQENGYSQESAKNAFLYYEEADPPWTDSTGKKVRGWKQKMRGVWFKPENKEQEDGLARFLQRHKNPV